MYVCMYSCFRHSHYAYVYTSYRCASSVHTHFVCTEATTTLWRRVSGTACWSWTRSRYELTAVLPAPCPPYILVEEALFLWHSFPRCSLHSPCSLVIRKINPCSLSFSLPFSFLRFRSIYFFFYFCFRLYLFSFSYFLHLHCNSFSSILHSSSLLAFIIILCLSFWII
jgi:hypothetical protein